MTRRAVVRNAAVGSITEPTLVRGFTRAHDVRTAAMVWQRELLRYSRTPSRIATGIIQAILYLFVLGYGLTALIGVGGGTDYTRFVFPGIVALSILNTATLSAISIVWDREFGFMREMLVAPVRRAALVLGKTAGGATVAAAQGSVMLLLAPVIGIRLQLLTVIQVIAVALLSALALTSFGVLVASYLRKIEGFQVVMQLVLLPMIFLSGATFPLRGLPGWLLVVTQVNPMTYAVSPLRRLVLSGSGGDGDSHVDARWESAVTLFGHQLSTAQELLVLAAFSATFVILAVRGFNRMR